MSVARSTLVCERIRSQVSLDLDGELSQLERRMLSAHLDRCPECAGYAADLTQFTTAIRQAPLELFERRILVRPARRRISLRAAPVAAAAMLAVAILGVVSQITPERSRVGGTQAVQVRDLFSTSWQPERELAQMRDVSEIERPGPLSVA
jgi:predicted anti-sigma-YlaC factor YlaD